MKIGEKVHVILGRTFETDISRHFIGVVKEVEGSVVRVEGFAFVFDTHSDQYVRKPETRTRIISLTDARYLINIIPPSTEIDKVAYRLSEEGNLIATDGQEFKLEISEFGPRY